MDDMLWSPSDQQSQDCLLAHYMNYLREEEIWGLLIL